MLLRRIEAVDLDARSTSCWTRAGFGRLRCGHTAGTEMGLDRPLPGACASAGAAPPTHADSRRQPGADLVVPAGMHHDLLSRSATEPLPRDRRIGRGLGGHQAHLAVGRSEFRTRCPARRPSQLRRDARTDPPGGGMVAAATLGLPERAEAGRNYDYRYVWLRDQAFAGLAASVDDPHPLLDDAVAFATSRLLEHGDQSLPPTESTATVAP